MEYFACPSCETENPLGSEICYRCNKQMSGESNAASLDVDKTPRLELDDNQIGLRSLGVVFDEATINPTGGADSLVTPYSKISYHGIARNKFFLVAGALILLFLLSQCSPVPRMVFGPRNCKDLAAVILEFEKNKAKNINHSGWHIININSVSDAGVTPEVQDRTPPLNNVTFVCSGQAITSAGGYFTITFWQYKTADGSKVWTWGMGEF